MLSNATFYSEDRTPLSRWREGIVYYWPNERRQAGQPAIRGRLICVKSRRCKVDVWLLTNVEEHGRLSVELASQPNFSVRLSSASRERRRRTSPKEKREWPRRKKHKPPGVPVIFRIPDELKHELQQHFNAI